VDGYGIKVANKVEMLIYRKNFILKEQSLECSHFSVKFTYGNKVIFGEFLMWFFGLIWKEKNWPKRVVFHRGK